jgi:hypothetical protein
VVILDSDGDERFRIEGYLPKHEFRAQLELALARVAFMNKKWAEAEKYPDSIWSDKTIAWAH